MIEYFQSECEVLKREDIEDLLQECLMHWIFKRGQYDPSRPSNYDPSKTASNKTYMTKIIVNKLNEIRQSQKRQKRKTLSTSLPLDDFFLDDDEDTCLAVEDKNFDKVLKSDKQEIVLKALEKLSGRQKEICRHIMEGCSLNETGRKLNIPRATLYDEVLRIRDVFRKEGLNHYL